MSHFWVATLQGPEGAERIAGEAVSASFFALLGTHPMAGRAFGPADADGPPVVVLSHELWQQRFGGRPDAVGRSLILNDIAHAVVGVLPPDVALPDELAAVGAMRIDWFTKP